MSLGLIGVLPVSGINLGLALAPPILQAEITQLGVDISGFALAVSGQLDFGLNPPNFLGLLAAIMNLSADLSVMFDPTKIIMVGADIGVDLALQLGLVSVALDLALSASAAFSLGLSTGGISAWSYSGSSAGLAALAPSSLGSGWTKGIVIATESLSSWGQFGVSVNTGPSKTASPGGPPTLTHIGDLTGGEICPGLLELSGTIGRLLLKLQGLKASLQVQVDLTLGINLPEIAGFLSGFDEVIAQLQHLLDDCIDLNLQIDLVAELASIQLKLDGILALSLSIGAQLSAGGLALWGYSGSGNDLGDNIASELASGIPGGSGPTTDIRALILAHVSPSVWGPFGMLLGGV